jgi:hypothetical protein
MKTAQEILKNAVKDGAVKAVTESSFEAFSEFYATELSKVATEDPLSVFNHNEVLGIAWSQTAGFLCGQLSFFVKEYLTLLKKYECLISKMQ